MTMKLTHFSRYLKFALLMAMLCSYFNMIAEIDEYTKEPILKTEGFNVYEDMAYTQNFAKTLSIYFEPAEDSKLYISYYYQSLPMGEYVESGSYEEFSYYNNYLSYNSCYEEYLISRYYLTVNAYAVADGKNPSDVVSMEFMIDWNSLPRDYSTWTADLPFYYGEIGHHYYYDLVIDGLYYRKIDGTIHVVQGKVNHCTESHYEWWTSDGYYYEDDYEQNVEILYYRGDITILDSIEGIPIYFEDYYYEYYDNSDDYITGKVGAIGNAAFMGCKDLCSVIIPKSVLTINDSAFAECGNIPYINIPVSVEHVGENVFYESRVTFLKITGEGEWTAGAMDVAVQRLDLASGITAIPGLKVNPREVYCYAKVPPTCDENTFTDYTGTLHVPESSLAAYFTAPYWCNFANIVGDAVELTDLTLNKDSAELLVGEQLTLNATIQPANASIDSIDSIIWESSNEEIATVVDGVVTAKSKGECNITVTVLDKRATCHVTVSEILPTSITLSLESALMEKDSTLTLTATVLPENATYATVTWSSSNSSIATVNSQGIVTAHGVGECDITATCKNLTATCHIKVLERFIYISLDQHRASLLPNHILTLTPTVTLVPTDLVVTSSNPSVAAARLANGKVQVVGVSVGTAIIKVASADGNAFADSCFVNVYTEAGDVDGDGFVKIDDVTALIDHLLGSNSSIDVGNADINYDGVVTIADVTELIDYLLSGNASMTTRETFTVNGVSFTMIRVPAGTFMMGATEEQGSDANSWEKPVHEVTLSNSYLIGETEVTQELWLAVMGTNPSKHEGSLQKPVENVSWLDCQEFISQLNALTGLTFRMPTEAEWEYAARGANRSRGYKYAGSNDIADVGNVSSSTTMPVGSLQPNELNIYDMSGNVDEWVWDLFGYYTSEPQTDPTGPADGSSDHMYRGGSWYSGANTARVSYRFFRASTFKRGTMGLRLAL